MKLGEALSERARLQRKIGELRTRINSNAATQEGVDPSENPGELIGELVNTYDVLETLIARINITNARTVLVHDVTLTESIAHRDTLAGLIASFKGAAEHGQSGGQDYRYLRSELKLQRHVDVAALQKRVDETARELRELDNSIQQVNWTTELVSP